MGQFPLLTLQDILSAKALNEKKLDVYLQQCEKHNILWVQGIIAEMHRTLSSQKTDIIVKLNSLYLLKQMVKTCRYIVLYLVEVYLLGYLEQIAEFYAKNLQYKMNSKYFETLNCPNSYPEIQKLSHNYVTTGAQILYLCSEIRPKDTFRKDFLTKDSNFHLSITRIKQKNPKLFNQNQLQRKYLIKQLKQKYKSELRNFQNHTYFYIDFYMKRLQNWIFSTDQNRPTYTLDFKLILKTGDTYLTSQAIARLAEIIDFVDSFKIKSKALSMINQLILWGDIQAVMTVNYTEYFDRIFKEIYKIDGAKGLKKGEEIFAHIKQQYDQKRKFYADFLRCLNVWAQAFPNEQTIFYESEQNERVSPIHKNYRFLKQVRKFTFPQNPFLPKIQVQIRQNLRSNIERNKLIIGELNRQMSQIEDQYRSSFKQLKQSQYLAEKNLMLLKQSDTKTNCHALMNFLIKFTHNFQLQLERLVEDVDAQTLDMTIQKGLLCIEIINVIEPVYDRFKRGKIKEKQFRDYCKKKINPEYFNGKQIEEISLNSSRSIVDRKSEIRNSINSNINKSRDSIKGMTEENRIKIIKNKYLQRLQKISNRTNSQKDDSFLNTSLFLNTNKSRNKSYGKLPLESKKGIEEGKHIREVKSNQKMKVNIIKSPRQTGKKVFVVTKYLQKSQSQSLSAVRRQIVEQNWNSYKKIQNNTHISPQKAYHFSFVQQNLQAKHSQVKHSQVKHSQVKHSQVKNSQVKHSQGNPNQSQMNIRDKFMKPPVNNLQKCSIGQTNKKPYSIKQTESLENTTYNNWDGLASPNFGNTIVKQNDQESRSKFKKGVGLAKRLVNLAEKLIGPSRQVVSPQDFQSLPAYKKDFQTQKQTLSKQSTILTNDVIQVDRLSIQSQQCLEITFFLFPKCTIQKIRFTLLETPSVYLNIVENQSLKIQRNHYQMRNLTSGGQYSFELKGSVLKTPVLMPELQIRINQLKAARFVIPFPLINMIRCKKPEPRWLGKDFDLSDQILSQEFLRNKQILLNFQDVQDYFSQLTQLKTVQNARIYRTHVAMSRMNFILEIKEFQNKMSLRASLIDQTLQKEKLKFFIAECVSLFS